MTLDVTDRLPSSVQLARELLEAAKEHQALQEQHTATWRRSQVARANKDMTYAIAAYDAYVQGQFDGKNEQMRQIQLDGLLASDADVRQKDQTCIEAQADLKAAEGDLESAKVWRSALHSLVALRISENGMDIAGWQSGLMFDFNKGG